MNTEQNIYREIILEIFLLKKTLQNIKNLLDIRNVILTSNVEFVSATLVRLLFWYRLKL